MNSIGGYFGLELSTGKEYHNDAVKLNTGRNALEYLLLSRKYEKIYLPYFSCEVLLQPIKKLGLEYEFYFIDELLEPIFDFSSVGGLEGFLYINYFGLKSKFVIELSKICRNLIIDNAQSFFTLPEANIDTFYSPRKYFGVSDGAYLYSNKLLNVQFERDNSFSRFDHLLRRIDVDAESGYSYFTLCEKALDNVPIATMSNLTQSILRSISYSEVKVKRKDNYFRLDEFLKRSNLFYFEYDGIEVPMIYPYLSDDQELREKLIRKKIYTPRYWPNVSQRAIPASSIEMRLFNNMVCLPIDQRYGAVEMKYILEQILFT